MGRSGSEPHGRKNGVRLRLISLVVDAHVRLRPTRTCIEELCGDTLLYRRASVYLMFLKDLLNYIYQSLVRPSFRNPVLEVRS